MINTGTTIMTFWMVFLIQRAQNHDSKAVHVKLDEIINSVKAASKELIDAEDLPEEDLQQLKTHYDSLRVALEKHGLHQDAHGVHEKIKRLEQASQRKKKRAM